MSAKGITLTPMRMGDLVSSSKQKVLTKYMPPSKRSAPVVEKIDMTEKNFPALGAVSMKVSSWGNHVLADPELVSEGSEKKETLSDKIKEKIRLDAIAEELGAKKEELELWKMTDIELIDAGWQRLRLSSARDIATNGFSGSYVSDFITEADSGMSFEEYMHYKQGIVNS